MPNDEGTIKGIDKSGGIIVTDPKTIDSKELSIVSTTFLGKIYKSNYTINIKEVASNKTDVNGKQFNYDSLHEISN